MWPFSDDPNAAKLKTLFPAGDIDRVLWSAPIDDVAPPGAALVDVVISSRPILGATRHYPIGLTYLPDGPVVRGAQTFTDGQNLVLRNVAVKPGAVLALACGTAWDFTTPDSVTVRVEASGTGQQIADQNKPADPIADALKWGAVALAVVIGLVIVAKAV